MIVGKTSSNSTPAELFSKISEIDLLTTVFPEITALPYLMASPLREDRHPSFSVYVDRSGHIRYKDYASRDTGGIFDLLCQYWHCGFNEAITKAWNVAATKKDISISHKTLQTIANIELSQPKDIKVVTRPWKDYDYKYWEEFGITKKWLKYAEVYPISFKVIIKKDKDGKEISRHSISADKYAYCFVERKEGNVQLKIYQPFNDKYKWCSKMDGSVIGLWAKIPKQGDKVVICSSLKDALCLSCQLHIPAICLQGEGYGMSDTAVKELKKRYKKIFICFDTDAPGLADGKKLSELTGFTNVVPDLGESKDLSDWYKSLKNKEDFKRLETLFI